MAGTGVERHLTAVVVATHFCPSYARREHSRQGLQGKLADITVAQAWFAARSGKAASQACLGNGINVVDDPLQFFGARDCSRELHYYPAADETTGIKLDLIRPSTF